MKLIIVRNQAKGMMGMGSVTFEVRGQAQLTTEEAELVRHYKLENEVIASKPLRILGQETGSVVEVRVKNLINGDTFKAKDLGEVIAHTENLESACKNLKAYLEVARNFGGQQVIEI
jgi:hypothetical protein